MRAPITSMTIVMRIFVQIEHSSATNVASICNPVRGDTLNTFRSSSPSRGTTSLTQGPGQTTRHEIEGTAPMPQSSNDLFYAAYCPIFQTDFNAMGMCR